MAATYEELIAKSRELAAAGDMESAKRVAKIAISRRDGAASPKPRSFGDAAYDNVVGNPSDGVQSYGEQLGTWLNRAGESMTLGTIGDEASGAVTGMLPGRTYEGERDRYRKNEKDMSFLGGLSADISGGIIPGLFGAGAVSAARTLPQAMARGMGLGAAAGATEGFMEGEGGLANRMTGSAIGGGIGAALGGAIPAVGAGIKEGIRGASDMMRRGRIGSTVGKELGVGNTTGKIVSDMIGQESPDAMNDALRRAGPNAMLADVSPQATGMLDMAMRSPIPAARTAGEAVDARASGSYDEIKRAMDAAMGQPIGVKTAQSGIRADTAADRSWLYGKAFDNEIDWNSPAGSELRGLLQTTPDDVLAKAARNRSMKARAPYVPDSAYADEFADSVQVKPGPMSGNYAERQDVDGFFKEYDRLTGDSRMKRPIAYTLKNLGGIDPNSPAAQDLRSMGITSRSSPGLFRNGGLKELDNLDPSQFPDVMGGDGTGNYVSRQEIMDALASEARGDVVRNASDSVDDATLSELDRLYPEYVNKKKAVAAADRAMAKGPSAPPMRSDTVPMKSIYDIDQIKRTLDEVQRTNDGHGLMGGQTEYGVEAGKRAREIRDLLAEISPEYKDALAAGADTISRVNNVEFGSKILRPTTTRESIAEMVSGATGGENKALRQGLRSQIDETLANVRAVASDQNIDARAASKAFSEMSSPAAREKMALVLGDDWPALEKQLDQAGAALGLRARTSANSATFGRGAADQAITEAVTPGALRRGQPIQAIKDTAATMMGASPEAVRRSRDEVKGEIAALLTRQGGAPQQTVDAVLRALSANPINTRAGSSTKKLIEALLLGNSGNITGSVQEMSVPQIRGMQGR
jgi:hypothetical protein